MVCTLAAKYLEYLKKFQRAAVTHEHEAAWPSLKVRRILAVHTVLKTWLITNWLPYGKTIRAT